MAAIRLQDVSKQFGTQKVLEGVILELQEGEIAGLVGANGAGKTTVFRLITGEFAPDLGTITKARGLEIGYLTQEPDIGTDRNLFDEVGSVFADLLALEKKLHAQAEEIAARAHDPELPTLMEAYEKTHNHFLAAGGHGFETRLHECLGGLGFSPTDYLLPVSVLSGGQKCRAALAKLLLQNRQFLLMDEPTNHLDIDAVAWLEKYLAGHRGGAVVISHDRYLLDRICTRIIELEHRRVRSYAGNYSNYVATKQRQELTMERQLEKDAEFIRKERDFIAKHLAGQRTKEAQGRRTRLERRLAAGELVTETGIKRRTAKLAFESVDSREGTVLRCDELSMAFGERQLFNGLTFQVQVGDRLGITGPNGTGKSTLLKIILGQATPTAGQVTLDTRRSLGYYAQDAGTLDPQRNVLEEIRTVRPDLGEERARSILGAFRFTGEDVFKSLGLLSGGEQSRVRLACLILSEPEILVFDEPTNHLDIPSREVLEESLEDFGGTIIVVSHDRYFLDRVVDRLLVLRPEGHTLYAGNYSFYAESLAQVRASEAAAKFRTKSKAGGARDRSGDRAAKRPSSPYDSKSIEEIEQMIMERETTLGALHARFGAAEIYKNPDALAELEEETEALAAELEQLNQAWEERVGSAE